MAVPSQADLKKREDKLKQFQKRIAPDGKPIEKHVISVVRSAIRSAWMKSDVKLAFLYSKTIPDMDPNTRTKWLYKCEICEKLFRENEVECDHRTGHHVFTKLEEFETYFNNILMVSADDLQILCKDNPKKGHTGCHSIKTLSESHSMSFEDARVEKKVIEICKKKASEIDVWLKSHNVVCSKNSNARRDAVRGVLRSLMETNNDKVKES